MGSYQLRYTHYSHLFVMVIEVLVVMCLILRGVLPLIGSQKLFYTVNLTAYLQFLLASASDMLM
jgi:hypothetical protein